MPIFQYTAIDAIGHTKHGRIEAADQLAAIQIVSKRGLVPVEVLEGTAHTNVVWWQRDLHLFGSKVARKDLVLFFQSFSTLIEAEVPLKMALKFTRDQTRSQPLKTALEALEDAVVNGRTIADAMLEFPDIFPKRVITVLDVGERSNSLQMASENVIDMLRSEDTTRREISSALVYPVILMVMAAVVMGIVIFHLTPTIAPVFQTAGAELPWTLRQMMNIRTGILNYWLVILIALGGVVLTVLVFKDKLITLLEPSILKLPFLGSYYRERETYMIAETIASMLQSGATITQALTAAKDSVRWRLYRDLIAQTQSNVIAGGKLSSTLGESTLIAPMLRDLVSVGEESDRLEPILQTASRSLARTSNESLQLAVKLLTPILTLLIGALVGAMIFSTISAVLDLNDIVF